MSGPGCPRGDARWAEVVRDNEATLLAYDGDCRFCSTTAEWIATKWTGPRPPEAVPWQQLGQSGMERVGLTERDVTRAAWWVEDGRPQSGHLAVSQALIAAGVVGDGPDGSCVYRRLRVSQGSAPGRWPATDIVCLVAAPPAGPHGHRQRWLCVTGPEPPGAAADRRNERPDGSVGCGRPVPSHGCSSRWNGRRQRSG
jgi:hypothetical protein